MKRLICLTAFLMCCFQSDAFAQPHKAIKYLTSSRISMLDFGLYRLEEAIGTQMALKFLHDPGSFPETDVMVSYDWRAKKIVIEVSLLGLYNGVDSQEAELSKYQLKELCENLVKEIRLWLGIDATTGQCSEPSGNSLLKMYFSQLRHQKGEPQGLYKALDNMTEIRVFFLPHTTKEFCKAPLLGTRVYFGEYSSR